MPADLSFLRDNIQLVAIGGPSLIDAQWFGDDRATAQAWADALNQQPGCNIYFTANIVRPGLNKKPTKADIVGVRFFHTDLDNTQDLAAASAWRPSTIINSGGGFNLLWNVGEPVTIDAAEDINRRISHALGADHCWNIDRILRVPGTVNWPNDKKRLAGRVPVWSSLPQPNNGHGFTAAAMQLAFPPVPVEARTASGEADVGAWTPLRIDDVPMSPQLRAMCERDEPRGSRSEHVSRCCAALGHAGFSNEIVMGLLMHPDNAGLHGHIADQHNPERAARRKVALAEGVRPDPERIFGSRPAATPSYVMPEPPIVVATRASGFDQREGGIMLADQQVEHFRGCIYVISQDRVLMPNGALLNQSRFDATMGGYQFVLDQLGEKTTQGAWEAFLRNQRFAAPTADDLCFRPEAPPYALINDGNMVLVNTYVPITTETRDGSIDPWLDLLRLQLPDERDRRILLSWMASCVQNVGFKAQWWPVIQGVQGNGKSTLLYIMEFCIGAQYCHLPNAAKMVRNGVNFTGWLRGKLFIGLEEIYSANRRDFLEEFKPFVTNYRLPIEGKGVEEYTGDNRANGMMLTNHKDGIPMSENERRYAPFFMAQQSRADLERDGLTDQYFKNFWDWMRGDGGFQKINRFLRDYKCEAEFDPAQLATRAPVTSSFAEAMFFGLGRAEQEVLEAIDTQQVGFAGGWVSSIYLDRLLDQRKLNVPRNKRRDLMQRLGYDYHPQLIEGRCGTVVQPDNARPRLYVKRDHRTCLIQMDALTVCKQYTKDQDECISANITAKLRA